MRNWYVIQAQPRAEYRALQHLRNQGYDVYLPVFLKRRRHARREDWVRAPLFPRYLFLRMDPHETAWRSVSSTVGVIDIVRAGDTPTPVPPGIIEEIKSREDNGVIRRSAIDQFRQGDVVQICNGALADHIGAIEMLDDDDRVTLLLDMLGRETRVHVPLDSISALR